MASTTQSSNGNWVGLFNAVSASDIQRLDLSHENDLDQVTTDFSRSPFLGDLREYGMVSNRLRESARSLQIVSRSAHGYSLQSSYITHTLPRGLEEMGRLQSLSNIQMSLLQNIFLKLSMGSDPDYDYDDLLMIHDLYERCSFLTDNENVCVNGKLALMVCKFCDVTSDNQDFLAMKTAELLLFANLAPLHCLIPRIFEIVDGNVLDFNDFADSVHWGSNFYYFTRFGRYSDVQTILAMAFAVEHHDIIVFPVINTGLSSPKVIISELWNKYENLTSFDSSKDIGDFIQGAFNMSLANVDVDSFNTILRNINKNALKVVEIFTPQHFGISGDTYMGLFSGLMEVSIGKLPPSTDIIRFCISLYSQVFKATEDPERSMIVRHGLMGGLRQSHILIHQLVMAMDSSDIKHVSNIVRIYLIWTASYYITTYGSVPDIMIPPTYSEEGFVDAAISLGFYVLTGIRPPSLRQDPNLISHNIAVTRQFLTNDSEEPQPLSPVVIGLVKQHVTGAPDHPGRLDLWASFQSCALLQFINIPSNKRSEGGGFVDFTSIYQTSLGLIYGGGKTKDIMNSNILNDTILPEGVDIYELFQRLIRTAVPINEDESGQFNAAIAKCLSKQLNYIVSQSPRYRRALRFNAMATHIVGLYPSAFGSPTLAGVVTNLQTFVRNKSQFDVRYMAHAHNLFLTSLIMLTVQDRIAHSYSYIIPTIKDTALAVHHLKVLGTFIPSLSFTKNNEVNPIINQLRSSPTLILGLTHQLLQDIVQTIISEDGDIIELIESLL